MLRFRTADHVDPGSNLGVGGVLTNQQNKELIAACIHFVIAFQSGFRLMMANVHQQQGSISDLHELLLDLITQEQNADHSIWTTQIGK